jgi:type I restriction enzyme, S subunit
VNADALVKHFDSIADVNDAVPKLRRLMLDLAVRGRLVPQDPRDEPASGLLDRIASEKVRLRESAEVKRDKSFRALEADEIPYDLPHGWQWTRIREVTRDRGQTIPKREFTYIDVTSINKEVGRIENARVVSAADAPSRARKIVRKGDVLYSCVRPYLLNIAVVEHDAEPAPIASTAFAVLDGFGLVLPRYQWIVLRSTYMIRCVERKMRGQAYPAINDADFSQLPFPLPPLPEQLRIVTKFDEVMALCDRLQAVRAEREAMRDRLVAASFARLNTHDVDPAVLVDHASIGLRSLKAVTARPDQIKQLRKAILSLAVRGVLVAREMAEEPLEEVPSAAVQRPRRDRIKGRVEKPSDSPDGWAWRALHTIAEQVTDGEHSTPPRISDEQVPLVTAKNVRDGFMDYGRTDWVSYLTAEKAWRRCRPTVGDLLLVCVGATTGRVAVLREPKDMVLVRSVALIRPGKDVCSDYLELAFRSPAVQQQIWESVKESAQPCLYINRIQSLLIPVPSLPEQLRVVAKANELMVLCERLETSLADSDQIRSRLLDALIAEALAADDHGAATQTSSEVHIA